MCTRGGGRGSKKPENMRTIVLIGCVKSVQEGGRGSKKPENLRTYLMDAPLHYLLVSYGWKTHHQNQPAVSYGCSVPLCQAYSTTICTYGEDD